MRKRKKKEREKKVGNSGHYVVPAIPKGSAHTSLGPIVVTAQVNPLYKCKSRACFTIKKVYP